MTLANANALFQGLSAGQSFIAKLDIPDHERSALMAARRLIRATLKAATGTIAFHDSYWQTEFASASKRQQLAPVEVKFMTQGSFAYGTLNAPAQTTQEIDLDDGMYVPVEFLRDNTPALTARGLFDFVVTTLTPLAAIQGWVSVKEKTNCVRVQLWQGAHVDIPIYSIPRDRYIELAASMAKSLSADTLSRSHMQDSYRLPSDQIMLARKDGSWIQSDPQKLQDWVDGRVDFYGPIFRRLCRFFKGWRDFSWEASDLSSLCLMCAVEEALKQYLNDAGGLPTEQRDDLHIMEVAKRLPAVLDREVCNPVLGSCLNEWDETSKNSIIAAAVALADQMEATLVRTGDADQVVAKLQASFGRRIPNRPDAVKIAGFEVEAVRKAPAIKVAQTAMVESTSG